jgi:hypothetical protein
LKFGTGVGIGKRMSRKELGEYQTFKMATRGLFSKKQMTMLPVDNHSNHKIKPVVSILGENVANYEYMPYG